MAGSTKELMDTTELAGWSGISASFWNSARCKGQGPKFLKTGRRVLYRKCDVEEWLSQLQRSSTKQSTRNEAG